MKFKDKTKKLKETMSFPASFEKKIARSSVRLEPLRGWIVRRVTELLEMSDEVVCEYCVALLEGQGDLLDAKELQISLQGFLHGAARPFVEELWQLLLEGAARPEGVALAVLRENAAASKTEERKKTPERVIRPRESKRSRSRSRSRERRRRSRSGSRERHSRRSRERSRDRNSSRRRRRDDSRDRSPPRVKKEDKSDDK